MQVVDASITVAEWQDPVVLDLHLHIGTWQVRELLKTKHPYSTYHTHSPYLARHAGGQQLIAEQPRTERRRGIGEMERVG